MAVSATRYLVPDDPLLMMPEDTLDELRDLTGSSRRRSILKELSGSHPLATPANVRR
jgi:hypothetical protein